MLVGQKSRDGSAGVGQVVSSGVVSGESPLVLEVRDAVLDGESG